MKSSPTDPQFDPAGSASARSPWRSLPGPLSPRLATLLIAAALAGVLLLGHDRRHAAQMLALALPGLLWLLWPLQPGYGRRAQVVGVWCWSMGFAIDGVVRGYLIDTYQATPDSSMVLASVANTVLIPMQDILGLGSDARMNLPGRQAGNWGFRFTWDQLPTSLTTRLHELATTYSR